MREYSFSHSECSDRDNFVLKIGDRNDGHDSTNETSNH